jgi:hypothetical protein
MIGNCSVKTRTWEVGKSVDDDGSKLAGRRKLLEFKVAIKKKEKFI